MGGGDGDRDRCSDSELLDSESVADISDLGSEDILRVLGLADAPGRLPLTCSWRPCSCDRDRDLLYDLCLEA